GGLGTALAVVAMVLLFPIAFGAADFLDDVSPRTVPWIEWAAAAVVTAAIIVGVWSLTKIVLGIVDLFSTKTVEGLVLRARVRETGDWWPRRVRFLKPDEDERRRRYFVAVDDGTTDHIAAWRVNPDRYAHAPEGAWVRVTVRPRLGYVRSIEPRADRGVLNP